VKICVGSDNRYISVQIFCHVHPLLFGWVVLILAALLYPVNDIDLSYVVTEDLLHVHFSSLFFPLLPLSDGNYNNTHILCM
jgi:hypothetical protein